MPSLAPFLPANANALQLGAWRVEVESWCNSFCPLDLYSSAIEDESTSPYELNPALQLREAVDPVYHARIDALRREGKILSAGSNADPLPCILTIVRHLCGEESPQLYIERAMLSFDTVRDCVRKDEETMSDFATRFYTSVSSYIDTIYPQPSMHLALYMIKNAGIPADIFMKTVKTLLIDPVLEESLEEENNDRVTVWKEDVTNLKDRAQNITSILQRSTQSPPLIQAQESNEKEVRAELNALLKIVSTITTGKCNKRTVLQKIGADDPPARLRIELRHAKQYLWDLDGFKIHKKGKSGDDPLIWDQVKEIINKYLVQHGIEPIRQDERVRTGRVRKRRRECFDCGSTSHKRGHETCDEPTYKTLLDAYRLKLAQEAHQDAGGGSVTFDWLLEKRARGEI